MCGFISAARPKVTAPRIEYQHRCSRGLALGNSKEALGTGQVHSRLHAERMSAGHEWKSRGHWQETSGPTFWNSGNEPQFCRNPRSTMDSRRNSRLLVLTASFAVFQLPPAPCPTPSLGDSWPWNQQPHSQHPRGPLAQPRGLAGRFPFTPLPWDLPSAPSV